jgi:predicted nucleotide-binding protein
VAILYEEGVERPPDIDGVAYARSTASGRSKLARELQAAEINVDGRQK